ncbi:MAG TPA: polysaccharide biosynthesis/export family protein, partial [Pyrinomonadaceae bacterium]|nr:polysaccharide biosynthesis/export family protein [Pyrinomonadaceae bacterium]
MNRLILALFVMILAIAPAAFGQGRAGATSQPNDWVAAATATGANRARTMNMRTPESSTEAKSLNAQPEITTALSPSVRATLNAGNAENLNKTRPRTGAATVNNSVPAPAPAPNQIYRIGIGDVLDVRLADLPTSKSTLFTVLENGLLDYPLSNAPFSVAGLTSDEIAEQ